MQFGRLRRLRRHGPIRDLLGETELQVKDLVMPYFAIEGTNIKEPIKSMPGIYCLSSDNLIKDIKEIKGLGIKAVLLFGISGKKDSKGSGAYDKAGIVQRAVKAIRKNVKDIIIITDVCLCGYTSHGHCGIIKGEGHIIDNDETIKILAKVALSHAEAGADFVAPSAMMDGQVKAIRDALDENGFIDTGILAYSAKYASNFYGPFREAFDSTPQFGDRKSHQMDYRNSDEALREIGQDIEEGADIVMVKPTLAYLDIIYRAKERFNIPVAAYNVSGEYAMVKGYCRTTEEEKKLTLEILTSIKRAGADLIITYHAKDVAKWLLV
ncbi:MAG: porphobilinogen synthase [Candidatus Omnitrophica bacterium]|nr:porphobilinogen synthase [Candidatus Omnitrophota bacterium]